MARVSVSDIHVGSGEFFSLSKYGQCEAIVFVPREMTELPPNQWNPDKPRPAVVGDFHMFPSVSSMVEKRPEVLLGATSTDRALVRIAGDFIDRAVGPFHAVKEQTKKGNPAWVLHDLPAGNKGTAEANEFADALDAQVSDTAPDMPDF